MRSIIAASLLGADFGRFADEAAAAAQAGSGWLHIDIMDGVYVPRISFGWQAIAVARCAAPLAYIDVHLMVEKPERQLEGAAEAGADGICFHPDATRCAWRCAEKIRKLGCKAGLAFSPAASLGTAKLMMPLADMLLVMTVEPGYGGQDLIGATVEKVAQARQIVDNAQSEARIQVDGGVSESTIGLLQSAGADTFVVGSSIFKSADYAKSVGSLLRLANGGESVGNPTTVGRAHAVG